jgi:hypothetical protein
VLQLYSFYMGLRVNFMCLYMPEDREDFHDG